MDGYKGLIYGDYRMLTSRDFSGILTRGGTILGTSRQPFKMMRVPDENGLDKVEAMKQNYYKLAPRLPGHPRRQRHAEDGQPPARGGPERHRTCPRPSTTTSAAPT